jgi:glycosyltransferase involved in cell wall biosynthesis
MRRLMACTHSTLDPASRFRVMQFIPHFERSGWQVSLRPIRPQRPWRPIDNPILRRLRDGVGGGIRRASRTRDIRDAASFDVVMVNRDLLGVDLRYEPKLLASNPRVLFDFDDAIFLGGKAHHVEWMCRHAAWTTVGNEYLERFARRITDRVTVLPTVVDLSTHVPASEPRFTGPFRVGWCGSDLSIRETLFPYVPMFARLQNRLGFAFVIVSYPRPAVPDCGLRWEYVRWTPEVERQLGRYMDVGIMPLVDNEFQRGKCGLKLLQYMAAAIPAIASPIGVNNQIVIPGQTGYLAESETDWHDAIFRLGQSARDREELGRAGRAHCERHFSLQRWFPVLLSLVDKLGSVPSRSQTAAPEHATPPRDGQQRLTE